MSGPGVLVLLCLAALVAGFFGGRSPARKAESSYLLNGLLAGVGITILYLVYTLVTSGRLQPWVIAVAALAIGGGALGGWVGGRAAEAAAYD
jgi:putative membrane protein (TIGR04086 family)